MSKFFNARSPVRRPASIPVLADFTCPACGDKPKGVVILCSRCWWLQDAEDRARLRSDYLQGIKNPAHLAKCVRIAQEKLASGAKPEKK